jgi:hypothetical protein
MTPMNTDQPDLLKQLSATRFVEGISTDHLQGLCRASRLLKLPAGAKLFQEGSIEDEVFVISSGHIRLSMNVPGRGDVPFLTTGPGELVGWSGLIGDGRMTATATAIEDTILIAMSGEGTWVCADAAGGSGPVATTVIDAVAVDGSVLGGTSISVNRQSCSIVGCVKRSATHHFWKARETGVFRWRCTHTTGITKSSARCHRYAHPENCA